MVISEVSASLEEFERLNRQLTGRRLLLILVLLPLTFLFFLFQDAVFGNVAFPSPLVLSGAAGVVSFVSRPELLRQILHDPPWVFVILLGSILLVHWQMHRQYGRTPLLHGSTSYELSADGLRVVHKQRRTRLRWETLPRAYRFGPGLALNSGGQQGFFLDLRRVQAPDAADTVLRLLRQYGIELH